MTDIKNLSLYFIIFALLVSFPILAQEADADEEEVVAEEVVETEDEVDSDDVEEVVVTGSRIKKSTFTSIAPLQIIQSDVAREVGLIDAASILQENPTASGQQIDLSFAGFSLDNGPGTTQVSLRGLGSDRTLVLINGRRVGPAGVEGAPYSPDLSLLPGSLIQRYEVLLDGASSVYGSDAIAGVTNAILRKDFDGLEFEIYAEESPYQDGFTDDLTFNLTYGLNFDRGFVGFAAEWVDQPMVTYDDRPWTEDCEVEYEITREGEIRTTNLYYTVDGNADVPMDCKFMADVGNVWTQQSRGPWVMYYADGFDINGYMETGTWPTVYGASDGTLGYYDVATLQRIPDADIAAFVAAGGTFAVWPNPDTSTAITWNGFQDPDAAGWLAQSVFAVDVDLDGDGYVDVSRTRFNTNGNDGFSSMYPDFEKKTFMAYGDFALDSGAEVYFEYQYAEKETYSINGGIPLTPMVPASNPYNICNPANDNGFDCGVYGGAVNMDPDFVADASVVYDDAYGFGVVPWYVSGGYDDWRTNSCSLQSPWCTPYVDWFGYPGGYWSGIFGSGVVRSASIYNSVFGANTPIPVMPQVAVVGDRTNVATKFEQQRYVLGITGDLDLDFIPNASDFTYDVSVYQTKSNGMSFREGVRGDRLSYAIGLDPTSQYGLYPEEYQYNGSFYENLAAVLPNGPCDPTGAEGEITADLQDGCVAVNMFAPSLYNGIIGEFADQAERDYLFDTSVFDTEIIQTVQSAYISGTIGSLQGGDVGLVLGVEQQKLHMMSNPDEIADRGLFFDFNANGGARGEALTREAFFELGLPLVAGANWAEELTVELSGRTTDTETRNFYKPDLLQESDGTTYSIKMSYRPVTDLLFRFTQGTSFRAPNLREVALRDEESVLTVYDYCIPPTGAWQLNQEATAYEYLRTRDWRDQVILDNCEAAGVDPVNLGNTFAIGGNTYRTPNTSITAITGGATNLDDETSKSITFGFVWDVDYSAIFKDSDGSTNTTIGVTRYDISIKNTIIEPTAGYVNYDCYAAKAGYTSVWCNNIERDPTTGYLSKIRGGFLNRDEEVAAGLDLNILHTFSFNLGDYFIDAGIDITANYIKERSLLFISDEGEVDFEDYTGEPGYPHSYYYTRAFFDYDDWRLSWQLTFIDDVAQDEDDALDDWGNAWGLENAQGQNVKSHTCLGYDYGDTDCRDVGFIDNYVVHNASIYYRADNWNVGFGIRNVFDKEPPMVDGSEISSKSNVPLGYGYNINGRSYFMNLYYQF